MESNGTIKTDETREQKIKRAMQTPESKKNSFHCIGNKRRGMKTTMVVREEETSETKTERIPIVTASKLGSPMFKCFLMENTVRLLASNNIPIPTEIPPKLSKLIEIEKNKIK